MKKVGILLAILFYFTSAAATQKLTILLDWYANAGHAPLFVAADQGFFTTEGLNVTLIGPANPADPPKLVAASKADIALTYEPQFMEQVDQGLPLIRIGTLVDKPLDCLVVLQDGPIKTLFDLKGKKVGYSSGSLNSIALKTMLAQVGLSLSDVEHININYDLTQGLIAKKIDAVTGMMRTFEVIQMELIKQPPRVFFPEKYGVPIYSELIFVIHKNNLKDPRFPKFLVALKKGRDYLQKHPETSWLRFAKNHPELNDELNHRAWLASIPYFAVNPAAFNPQEWQNFAEFMLKNGLIKHLQPLRNYAVDLTKE